MAFFFFPKKLSLKKMFSFSEGVKEKEDWLD